MLRGIVIILSAATLQIVYGEQNQWPPIPNFPEECKPPAEMTVTPSECCEATQLFSEKDFEECGFEKHDPSSRPPPPPPPSSSRPPGPPGPPPFEQCSKQLCLLTNKNLVKDENPIVEEVKKFIDTWAGDDDKYKEVATLMKNRCAKDTLPGPPHACQASRMMFCMTSTAFDHCPEWKDSEDCKTIKTNMDNCKTAILRQSQQLRGNTSA